MRAGAVWIALLGVSFFAVAAVRKLEVDDKAMRPIRLKMGKSSVIRFPGKIQRIVVGNKNYFNIEFVGNDLAIQPQREITTNLFVYGRKRVYGFLLLPADGGKYDDLVVVRWKRPPPPPSPPSIRLAMNVVTKERIKVTVGKVFKIGKARLYGVDATLKNATGRDVSLERIGFESDDSGVRIVEKVCPEDILERKSSLKCRIFFTYKPEPKGTHNHEKNSRYHPRKIQRP